METEQTQGIESEKIQTLTTDQPTIEEQQLADTELQIELLESADVMPVNVIYESGNSYCIDVEKGNKTQIRRLSNFVMRPLCHIQSASGGYYTIQFVQRTGKVIEKQFKSSIFSNARTFKQLLNKDNAELSFMGNDIDLERVKMFMLRNYAYFDRKTGIDHIGMIKHGDQWLYASKDKVVDCLNQENKDVTVILEDNAIFNSKILDVDEISKDELRELSKHLFSFNTYDRTIPIIGWCASAFFKERLIEFHIKISHLFMHGTAGSGKSETEETIIGGIFGLDSSPISCGKVKEFALLKTNSSSSLLPVILDEYKPAKLGIRQLNLISETLRSAYDGHTTQRGNADQSVTNYKYRAPIVILGESSTDEKAIKERSIEVLFGKLDRTAEHTSSFIYLKQHKGLLTKLGRSILNVAMAMSNEELKDLLENARKFNDSGYESRNINGLSNTYMGIKVIEGIFMTAGLSFRGLTGVDDTKLIKALTSNMNQSLDESGHSKSAVDQIIETMDAMALSGTLWEGEDYKIVEDKDELILNLKTLYPKFTKYYKDFNLHADVEFLNKNQFLAQVRTTDFYKTSDARYLTINSNSETREVRVRCLVLNLNTINKKLDTAYFKGDTGNFIPIDKAEYKQIPFLH